MHVSRFKRTGSIALFLLLLCAISGAQYVYDEHSPVLPGGSISTFAPSIFATFDLGLKSAMGSVLWLDGIQQIGSGTLDSFDGLSNRIDVMTTLDPSFSYPYAFAVLMVPQLSPPDTNAALAIGARGIALKLPDWRIPYYEAITYHLVLKDPINAAKYFAIAAQTPGIPDGIKQTSLKYGSQTNPLEQSKQIWASLYETTNDEFVRERAKNNVTHYDIVEIMQRALLMYKQKTGTNPSSVEDLVAARILKSIPVDPLGIEYGIDANGNLTLTATKTGFQ